MTLEHNRPNSPILVAIMQPCNKPLFWPILRQNQIKGISYFVQYIFFMTNMLKHFESQLVIFTKKVVAMGLYIIMGYDEEFLLYFR